MRRSKIRALAVLVAFGLVGAACGSDDDGGAGSDAAPVTESPAATTAAAPDDGDTGSTSPASPGTTAAPAAPADDGEPQSGGDLTFLTTNEIRGLDPTMISGGSSTGTTIANAIYDALMMNDNATGELVLGTAESITSDDGVVWELMIRSGIEFTDGTPYDAEAVKFNWERHQNPDVGSQHRGPASNIETMEVVDPLTLRLTLRSPNLQFPRTIARYLAYIASPTAIQDLGEGLATNPVGAGPFVFDKWERDSQLVVVRNAGYWNAPLPYLDSITFRPLPDDSQRKNTFETGDDMVLYTTVPSLAQSIADGDDSVTMAHTVLNGGASLIFNVRKPPFDDVRLRQAFAAAIDIPDLIEVIQGEDGIPAITLFEQTSPFYADVPLSQYDPERAQDLFDEVAAEKGPITFTLSGLQGTLSQTTAEYLQAALAAYGVEAAVEIRTLAEGAPKVYAGEFEAQLWGFSFGDPEPDLAEAFIPGSPRNFTGFDDAEAGEAFLAARASDDVDARREEYLKVQEIFAEEVPQLLYQRYQAFNVAKGNVHGVTAYEDGNVITAEIWLESA